MSRPILIIGARRFLFQWTTLAAPVNDLLPLARATNDNGIGGWAA